MDSLRSLIGKKPPEEQSLWEDFNQEFSMSFKNVQKISIYYLDINLV